MKLNANKLTERLKIRAYVLGLLHRAGTGSLKLPSSNELAKRFGVNRLTARAALEQLTAEGWLVTKVGSGTYTNPDRSFQLAAERRPLIGILCEDGSYFFYHYTTLELLSGMFSTLAARNCDARLLDRFGGGYEMSVESICASEPDALLWIAEGEIPQEYLQQVRDSGIRIVTVGSFYANTGGVIMDRTEAWKNALRAAHAENRRRAVIATCQTWLRLEKTRGKYEKEKNFWHSLSPDSSMEIRTYHLESEKYALLEELLEEGLPDLLLLPQSFAMGAQRFFETHGVDLTERLRLFAGDGFPEEKDFHGFVISDPWKKMGEEAVRELLREMDDPGSEVVHQTVKSTFLDNIHITKGKKGS